MTNIHVECGLVFGAATRKDGHDSLVYEPGQWYTQHVYSCASATKASIKTVQFRYNASIEDTKSHPQGPDLRTLTVESIQPKRYPNRESMPLWGVETVDFVLHDLTQLWGLISPEHASAVNLTTKRAPSLYLPGYGGTLSAQIMGYQNVPGTTGPQDILSAVYEDSANGLSGDSGLLDYTGRSNMAMLSR